MASTMDNTGERMIPEASDSNVFWEHLYRYKFATQYAIGRRVLDVACGEGYGAAALLSAGAASVIGVDISAEACSHAREKYGLDARVGSATSLPLPDRSIDLIVSFETIEHVPEPARFVQECARVLAPSGVLVISTPNVEAYNPERDPANNPFHCSEMTGTEFSTLLISNFRSHRLFSQVVLTAPAVSRAGMLARNSGWKTLRGYHRFIVSRFPSANPERERTARANPADEIRRTDGWLEAALNPFAVRPHALNSRAVPVYFVAVATNPIQAG